MFGISGYEYLLIAIVALIVIGPKELPAVLRTIGQWTGKVRRMAAEFQGQFHEAMREAEMADLKKEVDNLDAHAKGITSTFDNPMNDAMSWQYKPETMPEAASEPKPETSSGINPEIQAEPAPGASNGAGTVAAVAPSETAPAGGAGHAAVPGAIPAVNPGIPTAAASAASEHPAAGMADAAAPLPEGSAPKAGEGAVHA
jgi:sec-independent protein translocase protein TatB